MGFSVLNLEQGSDEWLEARSSRVTGTDLAVLDGCSPFVKTKDELLDIKRGLKQVYVSEAMIIGSDYEDFARTYLERKTGIRFDPVVVLDDEKPMLMSLDGSNFDFTINCEIKIPIKGKESDLWKEVSKGIIPRYYNLQMQGGMQVSGAKKCYFWVFDLDTRQGLLHVVSFDEDLAKLNEDNSLEFHSKYISTGDSPGDSLTEIKVDDSRFDQIGAEILALKSLEKDIKARIKDLEKDHRELISEDIGSYVGDVIRLNVGLETPRIDYVKLVDELKVLDPDFNIDEYRPDPTKSTYRISLISN